MKKPQHTLLCIGYGYSAEVLADDLAVQGWRIIATTRSEKTQATLKAKGVEAVLFDERALKSVPDNAHWLISSPPDADGCPAYRLMKERAPDASWLGYLSTTGVYGDLDGNWAFEWSERNPQSPRGERRQLAEDQWWDVFPDTCVFRLPGIYGPGRSAFDRLRDGNARRIIKDRQVFSRVHVEDIAGCVKAAIDRDVRGQVLHACDDEAAPPQDVIEYAARMMGADVPPDIPFDDANLSGMARSFYAECKRISNARTKSLTGWLPRYPTYREGLDAIWGEESQT